MEEYGSGFEKRGKWGGVERTRASLTEGYRQAEWGNEKA